ncbi:isoprenylcysteine carboxylmethyltransferase family protein [Aureibaculum sp. 2210JD6-5]|uniref:methyltransferase family protein n=1 Tax=Aureibaculum sp. 2210JD6-5 TaxID=3103957 RepID=UPI002AAC9A1A|nr:isoprenylcysteine carboxylmethyltransferase family protein [Aureibaculum sp. 2210JD6-5]MDY7395110.1 isoprenylcysteine carboxylmethyltransferase family protein [Aureibaculum sp. 2210JD6-5]
MKLKIPPALQFLLFALIMYGITRLSGNHFVFEFQNIIVWVFIILGLSIGLTAVFSFRKAKTSVDPLHPSKASQLVTSGLYRYTRNPMYLAMLFGLIAIFFKFGNYYNIAIVMLFIWYITTYQIKPEEKVLIEIFGDDFTNYCKKTRRWI